MTFYLIICALIALFYYLIKFLPMKDKNKRILFIVISMCLLFFISAFRDPSIGNDTRTYFNMLTHARDTDFLSNYIWRYEPGYLQYVQLIGKFSINGQTLLIVTSLIVSLSLGLYIYKYSKWPLLTILLFVLFRNYFGSMNILRQYLAMILLLWGTVFIRDRKIVSFILIVAIASSFHKTAWIFLIAYPTTYLLKYKKSYILGLLIGLFSLLFFNPLLELGIKLVPSLEHYLTSDYFGSVNIASIANFFVFLSVFLVSTLIDIYFTGNIPYYKYQILKFKNMITRKKVSLEKVTLKKQIISYDNILLFINFIGIFFLLLSIRASIFDRIAGFFLLSNFVVLPNYLIKIKNKKLLNLIVISILLLFTIYNIVIFKYRPDWNHLSPFSFYFN